MASLPPPGQPAPLGKDEFHTVSAANKVTFQHKGLQPPSPLYIQRDDVLVLQGSSNAVGGESFTLAARLLLPDGSQSIINVTLTVTAGQSLTRAIPLAEGFLLSVGVSGGVANSRGLSFAKVFLSRQGSAVANATNALIADYITNNTMTGWPIGRLQSPVEGAGCIRNIAVTQPAAGLDWSIAPGPSARWRVISLCGTFTTAGAVANRAVQIIATDSFPVGRYLQAQPSIVVPAATAAQVSAFAGAASLATVATDVNIPLPFNLVLTSSFSTQTLASLTASIQAADQWSNVFLQVEEWRDF